MMPWWLRAYLLLGTLQGLAIGLTGLFRPAHVVGFPLATTPLNTRLVAAFYLAGAVGLALSAAAREAADARIFVAGFVVVTALLLLATLRDWSAFTQNGTPYAWIGSYVLDPVVGVLALVGLGLLRADVPGRQRLTPAFVLVAALLALTGVLLLAAPGTTSAHAPWKVTATLARVYASIALAFALGAALAGWERRSAAIRPFAVSGLVLFVVAAAVSLVHRDRFAAGTASWVWGATLAAAIAIFAAASLAVVWRSELA